MTIDERRRHQCADRSEDSELAVDVDHPHVSELPDQRVVDAALEVVEADPLRNGQAVGDVEVIDGEPRAVTREDLGLGVQHFVATRGSGFHLPARRVEGQVQSRSQRVGRAGASALVGGEEGHIARMVEADAAVRIVRNHAVDHTRGRFIHRDRDRGIREEGWHVPDDDHRACHRRGRIAGTVRDVVGQNMGSDGLGVHASAHCD